MTYGIGSSSPGFYLKVGHVKFYKLPSFPLDVVKAEFERGLAPRSTEDKKMIKTEIDLYPKVDQDHLVVTAEYNKKRSRFKFSAKRWGEKKPLKEAF